MDMDFILPDDLTAEKMKSAYDEMLKMKNTAVFSLSNVVKNDTENSENCVECKKSQDFSMEKCRDFAHFQRENASTKILVLYFIFALGYNLGYGTSIFDTNFSMGRIQSQERPFGNVNGFFNRR